MFRSWCCHCEPPLTLRRPFNDCSSASQAKQVGRNRGHKARFGSRSSQRVLTRRSQRVPDGCTYAHPRLPIPNPPS
eukprot:5096782-Prymnesium_polylepis.1